MIYISYIYTYHTYTHIYIYMNFFQTVLRYVNSTERRIKKNFKHSEVQLHGIKNISPLP